MALKRLVFVLTALLFAVASYAAIAPMAFKCSSYECSIAQFENGAKAVEAGYGTAYSWADFKDNLEQALQTQVTNCQAAADPNPCTQVRLVFESSIDLGGFNDDNGSVVCANNDFERLVIPTGVNVEVDGQGNMVEGFCYIGEKLDASFFATLEKVSFKNLSFDKAYVKSTGASARAAVVAANMTEGSFNNVSVTNATVVSDNVAGGLVGWAEGVSEILDAKVNASLEGVYVGGFAGYLRNTISGNMSRNTVDVVINSDPAGRNARVGGLFGYMNYEIAASLFFSKNSVKLDVDGNASPDANNYSSFFVGGLAGEIVTDVFINIENNRMDSVKVKYKGQNEISDSVAVGGAVGMLAAADGANGVTLSLLNNVAKVFMNMDSDNENYSASKRDYRYLGGVIGKLEWTETGTVSFEKNEVYADIDSKYEELDTLAMGGLVAHTKQKGSSSTLHLTISSLKDVLTLKMKGAAGNDVYAGGVFGYISLLLAGGMDPLNTVSINSPVIQAVEGENLIDLTASNIDRLDVGGVIGRLDRGAVDCDIRGAQVHGDINVAATVTRGANVGGIAGYVQLMDGYFGENVVVGNIGHSFTNNTVAHSGFIVGYYQEPGQSTGGLNTYSGKNVIANYHYGTSDANVKEAIGYTNNVGNSSDLEYNYRNAVSGLAADGTLDTLKTGWLNTDQPQSRADGVISENDMKSRLFAYVMNRVTKSYYPLGLAWEGFDNELPYITDKPRTVYRVIIDVENSDLKDYDAAKPYLRIDSRGNAKPCLVEFTNKDGFFAGLASLTSSLGYGVRAEMNRLDLPVPLNMPANADVDDAYAVNDRKFKVVYEGITPFAYMWPMVEEVSLYNSTQAIPAIFVKGKDGLEEYYVNKVTVMEKGAAVGPGDEHDIPIGEGVQNFASLMARVAVESYLDNLQDVVYLKYEPVGTSPYTPTMVLGTTDPLKPVNVIMYGHNETGNLVAVDTVGVRRDSTYRGDLRVASKFGAFAEVGYTLKRWKVDFWIANANTFPKLLEFIAACGGDNTICEEIPVSSNSFGNVNDIFNELRIYDQYGARALNNNNAPPITQKRSFDLDASQLLDMDSLINAVSLYVPEEQVSKGLFETVKFLADVTPELEAIPYNVTFDLNAGSHEVFITEGFAATGEYSRADASTAALPTLYSNDSCFAGWTAVVGSQNMGTTQLDKALLKEVLGEQKIPDTDFKVYAQWKPWGTGAPSYCKSQLQEIALLVSQYDKDWQNGDFGDISLWQSYVGADSEEVRIPHNLEQGSMGVPAAGESMRFHLSASPKDGFRLSQLYLVKEAYDASTGETVVEDSSEVYFYYSDTSFSITPMPYKTFRLQALFGHYYNAAFQLKRGRDDVFFGIDSDEDSVTVVEGGSVNLPSMIYTADSCVLGWSMNPDTTDFEFRWYVEADSIYKKLEPTKVLYAVWADAKTCVDSADYQLVKLATEYGMVQLLEKSFTPDSMEYLHEFAADSTMLLPRKLMDAYWIVQSSPQPGYALDSLVMILVQEQYNSETNQMEEIELRNVFMENDTLPFHSSIKSMQAFFSKSEGDANGPLKFAGKELLQSGNAVRLEFVTNPFNVSLDANVSVALFDANGNVLRVDTLVEYVNETPYSGVWEKRSLAPGKYVLQALLTNGRYKATIDTSFTVESEMAVGVNTWRMVSLADVDMKSVVWDGDPVFYWWDESNLGGEFWQYKALKSVDKGDGAQGYWYNSLEGRPLKLVAADTSSSTSEVLWELDSVYSGWNLVANPYGWAVDINNDEGYFNDRLCYNDKVEHKRDKNGVPVDEWSEIAFWKYDPVTGYAPADTIGPYEGVWAKTGCFKDWHFNAAPVFKRTAEQDDADEPWVAPKTAKKAMLAKAAAKDSWTLRAKLVDGKGKADAWNVLGVGSKSVVVAEPPEAMGDHVSFSVVDGKRHLAKSVKSGTPEWKVELSASSNRMGYLSFEGVDALREYGLKVFVTVDGKTTEMREGEPLKVALTPAAKYATVRVAESAKVELAYRLEGVHAFQVGHGLQVSFTATNGLSGSAVHVDLVDLKGHVAAKASGTAREGTNVLSLEVPKTGVYMLRVRAGSQVQTGRIMVK